MLAPMCICMLSHVPLYGTLWTTYSLPGSWSMGFSWQEYWSILQFPPPGTYVYNHCKYDIYMNTDECETIVYWWLKYHIFLKDAMIF